jgi:hypothetical protein
MNAASAKKITLIALLFTLICCAAFSQGKVGYFVGTGIVFYNGDINERTTKIISTGKVFKPFISLGVNYRLGKRMETSLQYFYGNVGGADSLATEPDNKVRNLSFKSSINELSLQLEYHLFDVYRARRLNPYVFAGAGFFHFNPTAELNGVTYNLQPLGTEGQYIGTGGYEKPYKLTQVCLPVGIGVYFQLHSNWRLKIHFANHFIFTDYLDDVSTVYPDSSLLAATPNGPTAVAFSNRRIKGGFPPAKIERGNPSLNDNYSDIGITIIYNPGVLSGTNTYGSGKFKHKSGNRFNKKNTCPAYD